MTATLEPKYLINARKDNGLAEIAGDKHHPRIIHAFKTIGHSWLNTDEQAWCGAIMGLWMAEAGLPFPKNAFRALSWAEYGEPVSKPMLGAIAVMTRDGGGHVGIINGITADGAFVRVYGGNQGNKVCEAWFEVSKRNIVYRKPVGTMLSAAPVCPRGELSKSEA